MKNEISDEEAVKLTLLEPRNYYLLVERYQPRLTNFVRSRFISDIDDVCDVVQDSLLRGYLGLNRFDFKRKWKPWIYKITANAACDFIRESKNRQIYINGRNSNEFDLVSPEDLLDEQFGKSRLNMVLKLIEPKYSEILILCYIENKNLFEIARLLGLTLFLVRIRFERAKAALGRIYISLDSTDFET